MFSIILFISLIALLCLFILSFLTIPTGILFVGLISVILACSVINILLILLLFNFVFNRKNDKKKMIWSFIISLITIGIGSGLIILGGLNFEYIENDKDMLKTDYIELEMNNDLVFGYHYPQVEYVESNNKNIKIEYTINKYCKLDEHIVTNDSIVQMYATCDNPIKIIKDIITKFQDKKIVTFNLGVQNVKVHTAKENIEILKKNYSNYTNDQIQNQEIINNYIKRINELETKVSEYAQNEIKYQDEILELKEQIKIYESDYK